MARFITLDEIDAEAQRQIEREDDVMGLDVKEERVRDTARAKSGRGLSTHFVAALHSCVHHDT